MAHTMRRCGLESFSLYHMPSMHIAILQQFVLDEVVGSAPADSLHKRGHDLGGGAALLHSKAWCCKRIPPSLPTPPAPSCCPHLEKGSALLRGLASYSGFRFSPMRLSLLHSTFLVLYQLFLMYILVVCHATQITCVEWAPVKLNTPEGKVGVLATGSADSKVRLWKGPRTLV